MEAAPRSQVLGVPKTYYVNLKRELGESLTNRASDGLTFYII